MNNLDIRYIGDLTTKNVNRVIEHISEQITPETETLSVYFSSPGGQTSASSTLSGWLTSLPQEKYLYCYGDIASAAMDILVLVPWKQVIAHPQTLFMAHAPYSVIDSHTVNPRASNASELAKSIKESNEFDLRHQTEAWVYSTRFNTKMTISKIKRLFFSDKEKYYTPKEMKSYGLVDKVKILET